MMVGGLQGAFGKLKNTRHLFIFKIIEISHIKDEPLLRREGLYGQLQSSLHLVAFEIVVIRNPLALVIFEMLIRNMGTAFTLFYKSKGFVGCNAIAVILPPMFEGPTFCQATEFACEASRAS